MDCVSLHKIQRKNSKLRGRKGKNALSNLYYSLIQFFIPVIFINFTLYQGKKFGILYQIEIMQKAKLGSAEELLIIISIS